MATRSEMPISEVLVRTQLTQPNGYVTDIGNCMLMTVGGHKTRISSLQVSCELARIECVPVFSLYVT